MLLLSLLPAGVRSHSSFGSGYVDVVWDSKGWPGGGPAPNAPNACPPDHVPNPAALLGSFGVARVNAGGVYYGQASGDAINTMGAFGRWPALTGYIGSKKVVNGGLPQKGNLTVHLAAVAESVRRYMPSVDFAGDAVIDFEAWLPDYDANSAGRLTQYQTQSLQWVRALHPDWNATSIETAARSEFNAAARLFLEGTLRLCKQLRPKASWGFWGSPNCGSSCRWDKRWSSCPLAKVKLNDRLDWLYEASDALFTGIYLCNTADSADFVRAAMAEASRVVAKHPHLHLRPYVYAKIESTGQWLDRDTLDWYLSGVVSASAQIDRVVVWGGYLGEKNHTVSPINCAAFEAYFNTTLGPALKSIAAVKTDDEALESRHSSSSAAPPANPSRLPLPNISFSDDEQHVTVIYNGTTRTIRRPVTPSWNYTVSGSTFWVSPSGSDTAAGSASAPLRTLFAAVNRTVPGRGDAVFLLPGLYVADRATGGHNEEGGRQHFIHRGGTASRPLVVSCAPNALGKVLLRADPTGDNKSLSTPILTIQGNYTTVNGLVIEGTAGLPNAPNCACASSSHDCAGMCHFVQVGVSVDLITSGTDILGVSTTNCVTYHNNHCGYKLPGHASWGPGTRSEWLLRGNIVFATGSGMFLGPKIPMANLDHGFYMHGNDGLVIDGNIGWGIASWGIHLYGGGHGANKSVVTRNIMLGCRSGGCLITGHGSVVANNLFVNSSTGMNIFREPANNNTFVNNLAMWNQIPGCENSGCAIDADVDAMGGKCYHPRPAWPQCGPFNNTGNHNCYSKMPTHCTEATNGKCTHNGKGCCKSGFPSSASDLLANGSWSTVLTQWDERQELLDGRLSAGSPALGRAVPVEMPGGGLIPWLPTSAGFDLGPFQSGRTMKTDDEPELTALEMLRALPALPVVHYTWPFCSEPYWCTESFMGSALPWSNPAVMHEHARITHSVSTFAAVELPQATSDIMWEKLVAGVARTDAIIAIQLMTAHRGSHQLPTNADMLAQLHNATSSLERANRKLGQNASIGAVLIDEENHWNTSDPNAITHFNDRVYNVTSSVFGRDVNIQYYGRGLSGISDEHSDGWWDTDWYTLDEIDNRQLSTSLYTVPERSTMRIQYQRTLQKMHNESERCKAANAKLAVAGLPAKWCPDRVVPWISLGAGYKPSENLSQSTGYEHTLPWDYSRWYSWELGRDINNVTIRTPTTAYFDFAKNVALYPSAFDKHSPRLGGGDLTVMLLHFIAYCRGAAGITELPLIFS